EHRRRGDDPRRPEEAEGERRPVADDRLNGLRAENPAEEERDHQPAEGHEELRRDAVEAVEDVLPEERELELGKDVEAQGAENAREEDERPDPQSGPGPVPVPGFD